MAKIGNGAALRQIRSLLDVGTAAGLSDGQLLDRFHDRRDGAAELAFAALVDRHGPVVLRACRAISRDEQDAQDAFQATFLILVRKSGTLWVRDSLGPWLLSVAQRVSTRARAASARQRFVEQRAAEAASTSTQGRALEADRDELRDILLEEIDRLPGGYREALLLCAVEGLTCEQAARQLGWPAGTVRSRLARGKQRLRLRLTRRGLAPAVVLGAEVILAPVRKTSAAVPAALMSRTVRLAVLVQSGGEALSLSVSFLLKGASRAMFITRLKTAAAAAFALMALGTVWVTVPTLADEPVRPSAQSSASRSPKARPRLIEAQGQTDIEPDTLARVRQPFDARVTKVFKSVGDKVKKGEPLVEIYHAELHTTWIDFRAKYAQWQHDLKLYKSLDEQSKTGAVPKPSLDDARIAETTSRLVYQTSKDKLLTYGIPMEKIDRWMSGQGQGQHDISTLTILAPVDGSVITRDAVPGNFYDEMNVLMEVANLDHLLVWANVLAADRDQVRIGQEIRVRSAFLAERMVTGRVNQITEDAKGSVKIRAVIPNPEGLFRPAMLVRVLIDPER